MKISFYPIFIALIVAIGGFLLGFDGVVNGGAVPFYKVTFGIANSPWLIGISSSAIILGAIFGNFSVGYLTDRIGCKPSLILTSILFMIGAAGTALSPNIVLFIICKFIAGLGVGIAILVAPICIAEIAPPKQRGWLVSLNQLNIVIGLSVAMLSNYFILQMVNNPDLNWRWMLGVGFFPAAIYFLLLFLIPESPRWLIKQGRDAEGWKILKKVGGKEHADKEYHKIKASLSNQEGDAQSSLRELFTLRMRFILILGLSLAIFQQLSGINAVLYYAPMIFESAGSGMDAAFLMAIVVGAVFTIATVISMFFIDKIGRRPLLVVGSAIMATSFFLVSYAFWDASYLLNEGHIQKIETVLVNQALEEEQLVYQEIDSVYTSPEDDNILLQVSQKTDIIELGQKEIFENRGHIVNLIEVLKELEDQRFLGEIAFFKQIKQDLVARYQYEQKEIVALKFSESFKPLILKEAISINITLVLLGIIGFIAGFSISLGPVMWAMFSEIFPNHIRAKSIAFVGAVNAFTSFTVATVFPMELEYLGSAITYLIFGFFMLCCLVFVYKYVPETKGKSLEDLEIELTKKFNG